MNSFGKIFKVEIFGESHGDYIGITIDGCPVGLRLTNEDLMPDIERRKAGAKGTTTRRENDMPIIISGVFNGLTTGSPITILFKNEKTKSQDYDNLVEHPRPGHADFVARIKYKGYNDYRGGGHFSGRLTLGLVAAGVIAKKIIEPVRINAQIIEAGGMKDVEKAVDMAMKDGDSIGGIIECKATNMPIGLGEPFFCSVESYISHLAFSIPGVKGIEFGSGFEAARMKGSLHNDPIISASGQTKTNYAGGINGGITNGNDLIFRLAMKPTSSIPKSQKTFNFETQKIEELKIRGRHDACLALRVPVIAEAITAIALADLKLIARFN